MRLNIDLIKYVGKAVKKLRTEKGLTQLELSYEIGRDHVHVIKKVEQGKNCTFETLELIADVLNVRASYVLYLAEEIRQEDYELIKKAIGGTL